MEWKWRLLLRIHGHISCLFAANEWVDSDEYDWGSVERDFFRTAAVSSLSSTDAKLDW